jgi:ferredoxin/flavodoxin---NADP+ reductase
MTNSEPRHVVLIVGAAVSGAETASQLVQKNVLCIVLEQNDYPYGKIVDGLPRWHEKLRLQEMRRIDGKLDQPGVHFIPRTRLGRDLLLDDVLRWGVSAIVLANGAWRDRPLPLPGIDHYVGQGFYYQNPFVHWFNHYIETGYSGPQIEPRDGAIVVGGGLASLDVAKILMLETVVRALNARGYDVDLYDLEQRGVHAVLKEKDMTLSDLGLKGCSLVYRRLAEDMPLAEPKEGATPQQMEQTRATRRKLLRNFMEKYLFSFQDLQVPVGYEALHGRLKGLRLVATAKREGDVRPVPGTERDVATPMVISSIGSIPEPIPGIPMAGEQYRFMNQASGELEGVAGIFAVGNAVTGKGNILVSARHGRLVSQHMLEHYLMGTGSGYEEVLADAAEEAKSKVEAIAARLNLQVAHGTDQVAAILKNVKALQSRVDYPGNYRAWLDRICPR